jgi:hypothetical protein
MYRITIERIRITIWRLIKYRLCQEKLTSKLSNSAYSQRRRIDTERERGVEIHQWTTDLRGTTKKSSHPVPSRFILLWESHPVPFLELSCPVPSVPSVPSIPSRLILLLVEKRSKEFILSSSMQIIHFTIHLFQNNIYTTIFLSHKNNFCSTK